jgi:hypothetical protein
MRSAHLLNNKLGTLGVLLRNLLLLDGGSELLSETRNRRKTRSVEGPAFVEIWSIESKYSRHVGLHVGSTTSRISLHTATLLSSLATHNRDILQQDVELSCSGQEILPDLGRNDLSLGDQLGRVELRNGSFENLISDGRKNSLIVAAVNKTNAIESGSSEREARCEVDDALETKVLVDLGQDGDIRPRHDSKSQ